MQEIKRGIGPDPDDGPPGQQGFTAARADTIAKWIVEACQKHPDLAMPLEDVQILQRWAEHHGQQGIGPDPDDGPPGQQG